MKHTGSTLLILLFISLSYFILPHSLFPKNASAQTTVIKASSEKKPVSLPTTIPTVLPTQHPTYPPVPTVTQTRVQSYQ